jgi:hypothetical protein
MEQMGTNLLFAGAYPAEMRIGPQGDDAAAIRAAITPQVQAEGKPMEKPLNKAVAPDFVMVAP